MEKNNLFYEVTVSVRFEQDNGKIKKNSEKYLVTAVSVTDAEVKIIEEFGNTTFEFSIQRVIKSNIIKVIE